MIKPARLATSIAVAFMKQAAATPMLLIDAHGLASNWHYYY